MGRAAQKDRAAQQDLPVQRAREAKSRTHGFVSAVLLVVLLATTGWPADPAAPRADGGHVAAESVHGTALTLREVERRDAAETLLSLSGEVARPRALHRQKRIECGGLPPVRAPTA